MERRENLRFRQRMEQNRVDVVKKEGAFKLNFVDNLKYGIRPHWVNTCSNDLVKNLLTKGGETIKHEFRNGKGEKTIAICKFLIWK